MDTEQLVIDQKQLRWLAIAHLVYAGLLALIFGFLLLKILPSIGMLLFPRSFCTFGGRCPTMLYGWGYNVATLLFSLAGLGFAWANYKVGRTLARYKNRKMAVWVSGLNCLNLPVGTILGGCTLAVLTRDSVQDQFELRDNALPPQGQFPQLDRPQVPQQPTQQIPPRW